MHRAVILIFGLLILSSSLTPAFAGKAVTKDAVAVTNVEFAIAAMGGDAAVLAVKDSVITGTSAPGKGGRAKPASFVWKTYGTEFRYETKTAGGTQIFVSGFGKPAVSKNNSVSALYYHVAASAPPFQIPAIVLATRMTGGGFSLTDSGAAKLGEQPVVLVQTSENLSASVSKATQQTWYLDATTGLPLRVDYRVPVATDMSQWIDAAVEFADYRKVGDLTVPFSMTQYEAGLAMQVFTIGTVDFNVGLDPSEFDLLGGGK
jgi:hypothetical protein